MDRTLFSRPPRRFNFSEWPVWGYLPTLFAFAIVWWLHGAAVFAQTDSTKKLDTGKQIFEAACTGCHGSDGAGASETLQGFTRPETFPDFTDCNGAARERQRDWKSVVHDGGRARGFSEIMPSFGEALTDVQIDKVVGYLRGLCTDKAWPRGELNLPRAMVTEKAFPEDELVVTSAVNATGASAVSSQIVYERRFGANNQIEAVVPFQFQKAPSGTWLGGVGDLKLGYKRALFHTSGTQTGSIFSVGGEVNLPTGNKARGLGSGTTIFETFASFGQLLPRESFIQTQAGVELPTDTRNAPRAAFLRTAAGKILRQDKGLGRIWTPMVEFVADRDLIKKAVTNWDLIPQLQVSLSRRQHILASIGIQTPLNNRGGRAVGVLFYVLWDWFDGGLRKGW